MAEKRKNKKTETVPESVKPTEVTSNGVEDEAETQPETEPQQAGTSSDQAGPDIILEVPINIIIELPNDKSIELSVSYMELVQEIHQRLMDMQETCHRTCFHLSFEGITMDNFVELRTFAGLKEGSIVKFVEEPYTQRKVKIHVRHIRDMMNSLSQAEVFSGQDLTSPSFLNILTGGDVIARTVDAKRSVQVDEDCTPPHYVIPGAKDLPLAGLLLDCADQHKKALKVLTLSGWNPPPGPRKLRGDLLYLYVVTIEDKTFHITGSTKGFYVNCNTEEKFDPRKQTQLGKGSQTYHSLVDLLNNLSPGFKKAFAQIQKIRCTRNDLERVLTPYQVYSWLAPSIEHTLDGVRSEDAASFRLGFEEQIPGQTRDWNDELQSTKELPKANLPQRVLRERAVFKVHADFVSAAARGSLAVVDGNVLALNPGEDIRSQMFIWNNIFFSLGFDVRDHYKAVGGDDAAHIALTNDLKGVQAYFNSDVDGLHTLGTVVTDYRGYRVMAQSIIPGILEKEQDQSVVYGSIDQGKTVVSNDRYQDLLGQAAISVRTQPHAVVDKNDEVVPLSSSIECKGIIGDDGRHYILDLMRTFPPDCNYLDQPFMKLPKELQDLGFPKALRHKLATLRQELIEHFVEQKYVQFVKSCAMQYTSIGKESKEEETKEIEAANKEDPEAKQDEVKETKNPEETAKETECKTEILKNAAAAVNSLKEDEFLIRFNTDAFLEHVKLPASDTLDKERRLVIEAGEFLVITQIPSLVREVAEHGAAIMDGTMLGNALHSKGINIRYLGLFTKLVAAEANLTYIHRISVQEMLCRAGKHIFKNYMQSADNYMLAQAVSHFLNCLLSAKLPATFVASCVHGNTKHKNKKSRGKGSQSPILQQATTAHNFDWTSVTPKSLYDLIKTEVMEYFDYELEGNSFDAIYSTYDISRVALMRNFCIQTGIQLRLRNYNLNSGSTSGAFTEEDICGLNPIVKHMEPRATDAFRFYLSAQSKIQQGYLKDGFELIGESLQLMNQVYGPMHPEIVQCIRMLARLSYIMGDHETALMHQQRAVIMSERVNGFDSPHTIQEYGSLALYLFACGQVSTTLKVLYRMRYLMLTVCGEKHPDMGTLDANIGLVLFALRQYELALNFLESSLNLYSQFFGEKSMKTALSYHLVARTQSCLGDFRGALKSERQTYAIYKGLLGDNHDKTKESADCLRHLTQQAVVLQKQINELSDSANMPKNANKLIPPINVAPTPMSNVLDLLNIINGIIFVQISSAEIEALRAELAKKAAMDNEGVQVNGGPAIEAAAAGGDTVKEPPSEHAVGQPLAAC